MKKKHYRIRPGSIADKTIRVLPTLGVVTFLVVMTILVGLMNSWELGLI